MRKIYEKPFIKQQEAGFTNNFGTITQKRIEDNIEGIKVKELIKKFGSPLFVYSEKVIQKKYKEISDAFSKHYPKVQHAWSYKTNYLQAICKTFHKLGSWAEVVSEMEYEMAIKSGVPPKHIIFNGPFKPYKALKKALSDGAYVNIESIDELNDVGKIAHEINSTVKIGIRVNMSLGAYECWDRFGFNIESGYAHQVIKRALEIGKINITGISSHIGTFILEPEIFKTEIEKLIEFSKMLKAEFRIKVKYIDIGGGIASSNKLRNYYLSSLEAPSFERYAEAICEPLLKAFKPTERPVLIFETGRALIDEAGTLIASVCTTKRLQTHIRAIVLDAGVNLLFTSFWYDHNIIPTIDRGPNFEDHVIYGPLCMQIDVIRPLVNLPPLEKGDTVLIRPVGAYNNTQWMQFIQLRPNVIMIGKKGDVGIIREAETLSYLQEKEKLPKWLTD